MQPAPMTLCPLQPEGARLAGGVFLTLASACEVRTLRKRFSLGTGAGSAVMYRGFTSWRLAAVHRPGRSAIGGTRGGRFFALIGWIGLAGFCSLHLVVFLIARWRASAWKRSVFWLTLML